MFLKNRNILGYFPESIEKALVEELVDDFDKLEEIRLRAVRPIVLKLNNEERLLKYFVSSEELLSTMQFLCENSIYTYQNEIASRIYYCKRWT